MASGCSWSGSTHAIYRTILEDEPNALFVAHLGDIHYEDLNVDSVERQIWAMDRVMIVLVRPTGRDAGSKGWWEIRIWFGFERLSNQAFFGTPSNTFSFQKGAAAFDLPFERVLNPESFQRIYSKAIASGEHSSCRILLTRKSSKYGTSMYFSQESLRSMEPPCTEIYSKAIASGEHSSCRILLTRKSSKHGTSIYRDF